MQFSLRSTLGALAALLLVLAGSVSARLLEIQPLPPPGDFTTVIDNPYLPMPIGSTYVYEAEGVDGCEYDKVTITNVTKNVTIDGQVYTTLVVRDQAWESEDCDPTTATLVEDTEDYFAMETLTKNVRYFGEETYAIDEESDVCSIEGSWEAGVHDAIPGFIMLGAPESGDRYMQEFDEENAEDWGAVMNDNAKVDIEFGEYEDCLEIKEWSPLEHGHVEHKLYCKEDGNPGPGNVFIKELKEKTLYVEYTGPGPLGAPGEGVAFPAMETVGSCDLPAP